MLPPDLAGAAGGLLVVVALIFLVSRGTRLLPAARSRAAGPGAGLAVVSQLALDNRRRLRLVRCGDRELLVLTGGGTDAILPWPAPAAAGERAP